MVLGWFVVVFAMGLTAITNTKTPKNRYEKLVNSFIHSVYARPTPEQMRSLFDSWAYVRWLWRICQRLGGLRVGRGLGGVCTCVSVLGLRTR